MTMVEPYYKDDFCTIYNGDCLEIMPYLRPVDVSITSPPYNMRLRIRNGSYVEREGGENFSKKYDFFDDALPIEEYYQFHKNVVGFLCSLSKISFVNIQMVTGSKEAWFRIMGEMASHIRDLIVWDKGYAEPSMAPNTLNRQSELVLAMEKKGGEGKGFCKCKLQKRDVV